MSKILLVTVGGSYQPIVTAINSLTPERVIFFCSEGPKGSKFQVIGPDKPCELRQGTEIIERLPNIPTQVSLHFNPDTDLILIHDPDDLSECYRLASEKIGQLQQASPNERLFADYTGGTKTMSVALAMAALDYRLTLYLTTGNRTDMIKVSRGELTGQADIAAVVVQRTLDQYLPLVLQQYNYPAAIAELRRLYSAFPLSAELRRKVQELSDCCMGFDAWDRFDHTEAWQWLQSYMSKPEIRPSGLFLRRIISSRGQIDSQFSAADGISSHGYEIVEDLLLNAERRAAQERYDDAVGRLYRALELLAQIRLFQNYGIQTGDIDLQKLPESLHQDYQHQRNPRNGKIQLALLNSYELLAKFADDPLGQLYQQQASQIVDALQVRNNSLFAHGLTPIEQEGYSRISNIVIAFIQAGIAATVPNKAKFKTIQFPNSLS